MHQFCLNPFWKLNYLVIDLVKIGIIGGSGFYDNEKITDTKKVKMHTPYGSPSAMLTIGKVGETDVVFLPRTGENHQINPTKINYRANIWALRELGCTHIIATTACGSLRENYKPGQLVFLDQFIDRTHHRKQTFYEGDEVCHIPMAEPFCSKLRKILKEEADKLVIPNHAKGTMVTIEGPRFSTKAESKMFQILGGDLINMSTVPEAGLAREAGLCYASIGLVTDYDCWHESEETVSIDLILETAKKNVANAKNLLFNVIPKINFVECSCKEDIKNARI